MPEVPAFISPEQKSVRSQMTEVPASLILGDIYSPLQGLKWLC